MGVETGVELEAERGGDRLEGLPRHQQLIVSIFGLYGRANGGSIAVSSLIHLLGDLGAESAAVRSSVSRLKKRGVLTSTRVDGQAAYALVAALQRVFAEGDRRIFNPRRATVDEPWMLAAFTVPESERHLRHRIRTLFTHRGFGSVTPGLWVAPAWLFESTFEELERDGLDGYVDFFSSVALGPVDLAQKVAKWWDLPALSLLYQEFLQKWEPVRERWASGSRAGTDRDAFRDHIPLITQWRRLPYLDPGLPLAYLPDPWPGQAAADLFAGLNQRLAPLAERHARGVLAPDAG
ncbi:transcriptional regulator [Enemella dayhoffiae]|uniref:Transcriptional regulator n=1 Tax=Enemella dayhoffiae TaxID=2016507 RepID=A0A255HCB7_9ACTN|nr:PaaX family transcriptional regulator C-terminal domain-containing protein [Enemella dayhoffiae]OYO25042.1 transcriptional regulator [Enemella dayhoffiae]